VAVVRLVVRPLGHLVFVAALLALSAAARLLGDRHELGFFTGRMAAMLWRYPEVTRTGMRVAWLVWAVLAGLELTVDPTPIPFDEVVLVAVPLVWIWRWIFGGRRGGR
jgi:hypothetical protein